MDVTVAWDEYVVSRDPALRLKLIENYLHLVRYAAIALSRKLTNVEYEDLESYGYFGLMDAIEKFEPERGFKFETYAMRRIRGAIIDEIRSMDWVPRSMRADAKKMDRATEILHQRLARRPTQGEVATEMGLNVDGVDELQSMIHSTTSIEGLHETAIEFEDGRVSVSDSLGDTAGGMADSFLDEHQIRDNLVEAIMFLGQRERTVIALYYFEGLNFAEIGDIIGVTESRVCQIHTRSSKFLRVQMRERIAV
jgi:RNA polymerase sigma factor FliA